MAGISAYNKSVLDKAFKDYKKYIIDKSTQELSKWCWRILNDAIKWRSQIPDAHNFTGNLINSIVVCMYRERTPYIAYFSSSLVPEAIHPKMSGPRKRAYVFRPDYEGEYGSKYRPEIKTNKGWGKDDAERFFERYTPRGNNLFDIVVAYTVEYADWVNQQRGTTGILQTYNDAKNTGMTFLKLV